MKKRNIIILAVLICSFFLVPHYIQNQNEKRIKNDRKNFDSATDYLNLGLDELFKKDNPEKAIELCKQALGTFPQNKSLTPYSYVYTDIYSVRAMAYHEIGQYAKAVDDFTRIIEIHPNNPRVIAAYNNRAVAKAKLGNYEGSMEDFRKSLEMDPGYGMTFWERGLAKINFGKIKSGCTDLRKAYDEGIESVQKDIKKYCGNNYRP